MGNESRNREDGIMYWAPCTFWEMKQYTEEIKGEIDNDLFNENAVVYLPKKWATYQEIIWYTASVKKELATTLR